MRATVLVEHGPECARGRLRPVVSAVCAVGLGVSGLAALTGTPAAAEVSPTVAGSLGGGSSEFWQAEQVVVTLPGNVGSLRVEVHVRNTPGTAFTDSWSTLPSTNTSSSGASELVCVFAMATSVTAGQYTFSCNHSTGGNAHDWTADSYVVSTTGPAATVSGPMQGAVSGPPPVVVPLSSTPPVVRVSGNRLVDGAGATLQLRGVNRSGSESACIQGWGLFDGPVDDASVAAMASWGTNVVRLPLNEDCWLNINGVSPAYGGVNYQSAIKSYVQTLHNHGQAVVLDLQFAEPGATPATGALEPMPDADHAPTFWTQVAAAYRDDPSVIFDLFNEPHDVSWSCWRNGCTLPAGWQAAGMQSLVDAVRSTGATQPIIVGGLSYSNDMTGWLANAPVDPAGQLAVSFHLYDSTGGCNTTACWDAQVAPVAAKVPVITGELGQTNCAEGFVDTYMPWADAHGISYLGWTWNTWNCSTGPALITAYDGTPTAFGAGIRNHMMTLAAGSPAPAPTPAVSGLAASPAMISPNGDGIQDLTAASYSLSVAANVTATVRSSAGTPVRTLTSAAPRPAGSNGETWDGRDDAGTVAAAGTYTMTVTAATSSGTSPAATTSVTIDTTAPAAPVVTSPSSAVRSRKSTIAISGRSEAGSLVQLWKDLNGNGIRDAGEPLFVSLQLAPTATSWSTTVTLTSGFNRFLVTASDAAGNTSLRAVVPTISR